MQNIQAFSKRPTAEEWARCWRALLEPACVGPGPLNAQFADWLRPRLAKKGATRAARPSDPRLLQDLARESP